MNNEMEIEFRAASNLSEAERKQIDDIDRQAFSDDPYHDMQWSPTHWYVLVRLNGEWVSVAGIVERTASVNGQPVRLGGIGGVATLAAFQRRGLAEAEMRRAQAFLRGRA